MAANLAPASQLGRLAADPHSMVRTVVAQRAEMTTVREMMKRFPRDENLRSIYRQRKAQLLGEAGLPDPKVSDEEFDINGKERLGDAVKQSEGPELSDAWYESQAHKLYLTYDKNIESSWEEKAVANLVRHSKATSGVEIDGEKLLKALKDYMEEIDERTLERNALKELASSLREDDELLEEATAVYYTDDSDVVSQMLESSLTPMSYLEQASKVFQIRESTVPAGIKKHRHGANSLTTQQTIPVKARLPHGGSPRALDEQALDLYVRYWNKNQRLNGEPMKIEWHAHPSEQSVIAFSIHEAFEQERPVVSCNECGNHVQAHSRSTDGCGFMFECASCDYGWES